MKVKTKNRLKLNSFRLKRGATDLYPVRLDDYGVSSGDGYLQSGKSLSGDLVTLTDFHSDCVGSDKWGFALRGKNLNSLRE